MNAPESPWSTPIHTARRALPLLVCAALLSGAASACNSGGDAPTAKTNPTTPAAPKPVPALSDAQAHAVITHYSKINNEATEHRDRALLDTVEHGPMYAMSVSDYTETEGLPKADRKPYKPWSYDTSSAKLYIPRFTAGQDRWFAAALSGEKGKDPSRIAVFAEQPKDKRWELVSVVDLNSTTLPDVALDKDGYAFAVAATGNKHLAADADMLRTAVIDNFATGGRTPATRFSTRQRPASSRSRSTTKRPANSGSRAPPPSPRGPTVSRTPTRWRPPTAAHWCCSPTRTGRPTPSRTPGFRSTPTRTTTPGCTASRARP
ncbi:hypothetical protein [Streptomyces sp. CMB-StM0423]|uniref:hypothetical protein n=1 Tax=Streptomyces sp. CMB-StM0423 TaxID=2059884 RepID=UPI001F2F9B5B|nr:hypothetical protein [Streptomyces sp. CMB-StM0423]